MYVYDRRKDVDEGVKPGKRQSCMCTTEEKNMDGRDYVKGGGEGRKDFLHISKDYPTFCLDYMFYNDTNLYIP